MLNRRNLSLAAGMAAAVLLAGGAIIASVNGPAHAAPAIETGKAAPDFTATGSNGEAVSLASLKGKTVVLEWTNDGCPFVKKHYAEPVRNMQTLQAGAKTDDVVWLSVISSAPGKQGHVDGKGANALSASRGATPAHVLLDPEGTLGKLYGAKTTPHMFVINADGALVYDGAIDSKASANVADIAKAENYVSAALTNLKAGKPVQTARTKPYGCSVKYYD